MFILLAFLFLCQTDLYSQIDDIKKKSKENKENKSNFSGDSNSDDDGNQEDGILAGCFSGCVDFGCSIFGALIADYTANVYTLKPKDPSILSLDLYTHLAPAYHFSSSNTYPYLNFLPGFRAHLVSFMIDFRYNLLAEFTDDVPNTFKTWDLILAFKIVPSEKFNVSIGTGVQREIYSALYFHEYYLGSKIGTVQNRDYLVIDFRCSADYETSTIPFIETGIRYNWRVLNFTHLYGHLSLGGMYQNYYQSHDIWGTRGGIILNWH